MEETRTSETSVETQRTTRRLIPEDDTLQHFLSWERKLTQISFENFKDPELVSTPKNVCAGFLESESRYDGQAAGQSALVSSPIWGSWPDVCYCFVSRAPPLTRGRVCHLSLSLSVYWLASLGLVYLLILYSSAANLFYILGRIWLMAVEARAPCGDCNNNNNNNIVIVIIVILIKINFIFLTVFLEIFWSSHEISFICKQESAREGELSEDSFMTPRQ
jgi:hypothetical protein